MRTRILLASAALHGGLVIGAVALPGLGTVRAEPRPARLALLPSEPAVAVAEPSRPVARVVVVEPEPFDEAPAPDIELPDPRFAEPVATPPEPPPTAPSPWPIDPDARVVARTETAPVVVEPTAESAFVPALADADRNRPPVYPTEARVRGHEGKVVLDLHVAADGVVADVTLVEPCRYPELNRAAIVAARTWLYAPASRDGVPEPSAVRQSFEFRLR
jgi:protein TonB